MASDGTPLGRERVDQEAGHEVAQSIVSTVRDRDIFRARTPEGRARMWTS
jgi:hypothetical protein